MREGGWGGWTIPPNAKNCVEKLELPSVPAKATSGQPGFLFTAHRDHNKAPAFHGTSDNETIQLSLTLEGNMPNGFSQIPSMVARILKMLKDYGGKWAEGTVVAAAP